MKLRDYLITTFAPLLGVFSTNAADASVLENMANEAVRTENHAPMPLFNETKYYDTETIFVPDFEGGNGDDDDKFKKKVQSESNQDTTKLDVVKEVLNINHHDYKSISLEKRNPDDMFERNVDALINNEGDSTLEFTVNQVRMAEQTPSDEIAFTPDGKYFAFTRKSSTKKNKDELFVINKENDSLIQLVNEYNYIKDLNLSSDGKSISFLASKNGRKYHTVYSFFEEGVRAEDYVLKKNISKMSITDVIVKDVPTSVIQRKNLFGSKVEMIQPLGFSKRRLSSVGINA
ncbi:MAG: hypothetical protein U9R00_01750, partial [Patescibacteria group bacterium]|nr:hypothetical protein [Patescibacteria group bacterium]